jgi:hypothetical protein
MAGHASAFIHAGDCLANLRCSWCSAVSCYLRSLSGALKYRVSGHIFSRVTFQTLFQLVQSSTYRDSTVIIAEINSPPILKTLSIEARHYGELGTAQRIAALRRNICRAHTGRQ